MNLKKSLVIMVATSLLTMSLASCSSGDDKQSSIKSEVYAPTDKDTLIKGNMTEPESLDPIHVSTNVSAAIEYDLGEGLLGENQANQPIPAIATSWKISDNNLVYTFYLRKDAKWSNGEPITAEDFVYSLRRAVNPKMLQK
ncbi:MULTISPECIES: ABC transporter substrate-binding protein [unclassified Francisella]|uniref:ABC transporter substrate-binding protein n=1 Tax=unclassified Francisella TaxID=2610885 RepID=UPI002E35962C|nr:MULTISPECIES: ABC transporter substrate-binding protein [unclassified Francisella]MED7819078.1 ABC transporter substrate-binding protein [Francisella sp. 19S2-4]MED7829915.1 ABC transporter substrate-binding protein [Francisella sp. 19S2-10]